jgi:hypothetical protein
MTTTVTERCEHLFRVLTACEAAGLDPGAVYVDLGVTTDIRPSKSAGQIQGRTAEAILTNLGAVTVKRSVDSSIGGYSFSIYTGAGYAVTAELHPDAHGTSTTGDGAPVMDATVAA